MAANDPNKSRTGGWRRSSAPVLTAEEAAAPAHEGERALRDMGGEQLVLDKCN